MDGIIAQIEGKAFDYIIAGGGTAGCLLANRLATGLPHATVLLLEGGGDASDDPDTFVPGLMAPKFGADFARATQSTPPQRELKGRVLLYPPFRGLGGSSASNFLAWVRGPKCDYDDWAEKVGDAWWKWDNVVHVMNKLEDFRPDCAPGNERFAKPTPGAHGKGGPIAVSYGTGTWQPLLEYGLRAGSDAGYDINTDYNDGDPLGLSVLQTSMDSGTRVTSATAFLGPAVRQKLTNLTIVKHALCTKVAFDDKRAAALEVLPSKEAMSETPATVFASKEIILTLGCFHSPALLLRSGVGPREDLAALNIPLVHDSPNVGRNLQDHSMLSCEFIIKKDIEGHNQLLNDPAALQEAREKYDKSGIGPLAEFGSSASIIFPRLPTFYESQEFKSLPQAQKQRLSAPQRPTTEIWTQGGPLFYLGPCPPDASVLCLEGLCQNQLSRGTLKLASKHPRDLPIIDQQYLSEPVDLRLAIETVREIMRLASMPTFAGIIESVLHGPRSPHDAQKLASIHGEDDAVIEDFVRETLVQGNHSISTCAMGRAEDGESVVDADCKVLGASGLRIADNSVCPVLTVNHTQVNAYLIAERCAEAILGSR